MTKKNAMRTNQLLKKSLLLLSAIIVLASCESLFHDKGEDKFEVSVSDVQGVPGSKIAYSTPDNAIDLKFTPTSGSMKSSQHITGDNGIWIGETEVVFSLWKEVRDWAVNNGYNMREGIAGNGSGATSEHPVTTVSWRDAVVWCNAFTEYYNAHNGDKPDYSFVYTYNGEPVMDSDLSNTNLDNVSDDMGATGFRLPTNDEWYAAASYENTPEDYASGATANYENEGANFAVAWYRKNSDSKTHPPRGKLANLLGLYDMSGNVRELVYDKLAKYEGKYNDRGGAWNSNANKIIISEGAPIEDHSNSYAVGFRLARTLGDDTHEDIGSNTGDPITEYDNSLIIAFSTTSSYVIVSPNTGDVVVKVQPDVIAINQLALGYNSQKAIVTSKEPGGSAIKAIFTCDRETGNNLFQVTSEQDWDVMFVDGSPTDPQIVFSAQNARLLSDDNIHKINEDGTGYMRLSSPDEAVDCLGISCYIFAAYDPVWSPDAAKIAFDIHLREVGELHPHNSICIMDADGNNKQVLYDNPVEEQHYSDLCFTQDGQFIVFLEGQANETQAKVLHISSKTVVDITNYLLVEGLHPTDIWTSPKEDKIIFNKYEPGGGDLYRIDYTVNGDQFQINGNYEMLSSNAEHNEYFGAPDWQLWDRN